MWHMGNWNTSLWDDQWYNSMVQSEPQENSIENHFGKKLFNLE